MASEQKRQRVKVGKTNIRSIRKRKKTFDYLPYLFFAATVVVGVVLALVFVFLNSSGVQ